MVFEHKGSKLDSVRNSKYGSVLREPRQGVMLHYDGSSTDKGAIAWFKDPRAEVSYQNLVLDDGSYVSIAPIGARAWHAGYCKPSSKRFTYKDGNSAFYGIAAATDGKTAVTATQLLTIADLCVFYFKLNGWSLKNDLWRITGHSAEAVYGPNDPRAGMRGRKIDPEGNDSKKPILSVEDVRYLVSISRR